MDFDPVLLKLDKLISMSRLKDIAFIVDIDIGLRISKMASAIDQLRAGAYLLGSGPSTVGIIPLSVDEIILGRSSTILEEPVETLIDYTVSDTTYFTPREVSRVHAKIVRENDEEGAAFYIVDLGSTCGTYVNHDKIHKDEKSKLLGHGDIISLGPSMVSTSMFYLKEQ